LAKHHTELLSAGARVAGISVDRPEQSAAMVEKLRLPYPLLSDPEGAQAIKPYGLWHEGQTFGKPAVVLLRPDGTEALRQVGEDFADRLPEEDLVAAVQAENLPTTSQPAPAVKDPQPGPNAVNLSWLPWYFRGSKMAVVALSGRVPEAKDDARAMRVEYDRFLDALQWLEGQRP
jgi:hypothetical protein